MLFYTHLLLLLQPSVLWLSIVTFNDAKPPPKKNKNKNKNKNKIKIIKKIIKIISKKATAKVNFVQIWSITNPTLARQVTPPWNVYMAKFDPGWEGYPVWQTGLPGLAGHPTYQVNVIKLKWEIIWTGGLHT